MMTLDDIAKTELRVARSRYVGVIASWALDEVQAGRLLGIDRFGLDVPDLAADAEARMRLVVEIDRLLSLRLSGVEVADWIRESSDAFIGCLSPLEAMFEGRHVLRSLRNVLADRPRFA